MLYQVMGGVDDVLGLGLMVLVVDSQRLRGEATAAALSAVGIAATWGAPGSCGADVALVHDGVPSSGDLEELLDDASCRTLVVVSGRLDERDSRVARAFGVLDGSRLTVETLAAAVRDARAGRRPQRWTPTAPATEVEQARKLVATLSPRERSILRLVASAQRNDEIGAELQISANTVRTHVQNILGKLEVSSRVAAVSTARRAGLDLEARPERGAS
jgi:DNA-binding NarL/FixJ family response regulator